ncbi:MAG: DUF3006 domain-containing protein [Oscillospiraceae bacterium]|nr:DUF3006 domain-containing protein [Oscillospiraceae bacterium]
MSNREYYSVSRIEDGIAVLECPDKIFREFSLDLLPLDAVEGNVLIKDENGQFVLDRDEEQRRKRRLLDLQNKIFG